MAVCNLLNLRLVCRGVVLIWLCEYAFGTEEVDEKFHHENNGKGLANSWRSIYYGRNMDRRMLDQHAIHKNIENTGISLFAVFDGHGGSKYSAVQAKEILVGSLCEKIVAAFKIAHGESPPLALQKPKLEDNAKPKTYGAAYYVDKNRKINFHDMLTDEILAFDHELVAKQIAMKDTDTPDYSGTTALIAIVDGERIVVANVGDCRAVLCDSNGKAVPLSVDHRISNENEYNRVKAAGATFKGKKVVAGKSRLAVTRALGDWDCKDCESKIVIAVPTFEEYILKDPKPKYLIMASDGIWDGISNEEAVEFVQIEGLTDFGGYKIMEKAVEEEGVTDNFTLLIFKL